MILVRLAIGRIRRAWRCQSASPVFTSITRPATGGVRIRFRKAASPDSRMRGAGGGRSTSSGSERIAGAPARGVGATPTTGTLPPPLRPGCASPTYAAAATASGASTTRTSATRPPNRRRRRPPWSGLNVRLLIGRRRGERAEHTEAEQREHQQRDDHEHVDPLTHEHGDREEAEQADEHQAPDQREAAQVHQYTGIRRWLS